MSLLGIFVLALGLAADSFAASVARGAQAWRPRIRHALLIAGLFGGVQVLMPLIGWKVGVEFRPVIEKFDHWIAFAILLAIGAKMIHDGLTGKPEIAGGRTSLTFAGLLLAAVATSVDSLVAGFSFGVLHVSVLAALAMIGAVTFVLSFAGLYIGHRFSAHAADYIEIGGGLILIGIGTKILIDHTL